MKIQDQYAELPLTASRRERNARYRAKQKQLSTANAETLDNFSEFANI
jgi:hypothetical protein